MKRMLTLLLTAVLLLSGCDLLPAAVNDLLPGTSGSSGETPGTVNRDTGVKLHDNAPSLAQVGVEEYLAYFQESDDFVTMPDFQDERNPYEPAWRRKRRLWAKTLRSITWSSPPWCPILKILWIISWTAS